MRIHIHLFLMAIACAALLQSCKQKPKHQPITELAHIPPSTLPEPIHEQEMPKGQEPRVSVADANNPNKIDFDVSNLTGKTVYITCFSYQRKHYFGNWRWDKSPIYMLENGKTITVNVGEIPDEQDRKNVYGYLAVFNQKQNAEDATFELLSDKKKLDLDLLCNLKDKKVTLEIESYGAKGEFFDYDFVPKEGEEEGQSLSFGVENDTGRPIFVTCFVYEKRAKSSWIGATEKKDDMTVWRFDKTPVIKIAPGDTGTVSTETIETRRDLSYIRGYLAVFDEAEEELANRSTYELLETKRKLNIGQLLPLAHKKIVIEAEEYGILEDFFDYVIKPQSKIDFATLKHT